MVFQRLPTLSVLLLVFWLCSVSPGYAQQEPDLPDPVVPVLPIPPEPDSQIVIPTLPSNQGNPLNIEGSSQNRTPRNAGLPRISGTLNRLYETFLADDLQPSQVEPGLQVQQDRVKVMITLQDSASAYPVTRAVEAGGGTMVSHYRQWLSAWVPISLLETLSAQPGIMSVVSAIPVEPVDAGNLDLQLAQFDPLSGTHVTEGVAASNANVWHDAGYTGEGVKVGVIDSFQSYTDAQAAGELPPNIETYGTLYLGSPHGTAVAEIIYDMAPGVEFVFSSPADAVEMGAHIVALAEMGVDIISSSIGPSNSESGDGLSGPISDAIAYASTEYGVLFVQAAGNQAQYNWNDTFRDTDGDGLHEFDDGGEVNILKYGLDYVTPAGYPLVVYLRWNDWALSDQDYDLHLYYYDASDGWTWYTGSTDAQTGTQPPTERIGLYAPFTAIYGIVIQNYAATGDHVMDLMGYNIPAFYFNHTHHSLVDAATSSYALSVAALDALAPYPLKSYSSQGPTMGPGGILTGGTDQPRLSGFANVETWSYGPGIFNGTSSATPHVSGAAALVLSAFGDYTNSEIRAFLESRAVDMGDPGYDHTYGMGRLYLGDPPEEEEPTATPTLTATLTHTPTDTPTDPVEVTEEPTAVPPTATLTPTTNPAPVAQDDAYTTPFNTALEITLETGVLQNDVDADPLGAVLGSNPQHGTLTLRTDGTFRYVPGPYFTGSDTFTYHADDGTSGSNVATVTIDIVVPNELMLLTPRNEVDFTYGHPVYIWPDVSDEVGYEVYLAPKDNLVDARFYNTVDRATFCDGKACAVDLTQLEAGAWLTNGTYSLYINPDPGNLNTWAGPFDFTVDESRPRTVSPLETTGVQSLYPIIHWRLDGTAVNSAWFQLVIVPTDDLADAVVLQWVLRDTACGDRDGIFCSFQIPEALEDGRTYSAFIQSWGPGGLSFGGVLGSGWKDVPPFTVDLPPLSGGQ